MSSESETPRTSPVEVSLPDNDDILLGDTAPPPAAPVLAPPRLPCLQPLAPPPLRHTVPPPLPRPPQDASSARLLHPELHQDLLRPDAERA
ncbi:unnamed protein product [Urochloa humidicola]